MSGSHVIEGVIFLDIDGVLNNPGCYAKGSGNRVPADPACVAALNHITETTGAVIVISSTWRLAGTMFCKDKLHEWGVTGNILDRTPALYKKRGYEIGQWLTDNLEHYEVRSYVILDDDSDMAGHLPRLVQTNRAVGLTMADAERAIALLRTEAPRAA